MRRLLPLLVLATAPLYAQETVHVDASVEPRAARVGETVRFEVTVRTTGAEPSIEAPRLPAGLELLGTSDFSEIQFRLPGGRSRVVTRQFVLQPRTPGRLRIPPVEVRVDGGRYHTRPLVLEVEAGLASGAAGTGGVMLRAELVPDTAYVGEQVTLRTEALFSEAVRGKLRRPPEYLPPNPPGFWVHDVGDYVAGGSRVIGGRSYQFQGFRRVYFPLSAGEYTLPPARLSYETSDGFLAPPQTHEIASDSPRLVVRALPVEGRPAAFTGAVGSYGIRARLEPATVAAGEPAVLTVEIEGVGNIKALPPPALPALDGVRVFRPTEESQVETSGASVRGAKTFSWMLVPERPGRLQIPEIAYGYFDPATEAYEVVRVEPFALDVTPGGAGIAEAPAQEQGLRPLAAAPAGPSLGWVRSPLFAAVQALPLLAILGALASRRRADRPRAPSRRLLRRRRRQALARLRRLADAGGADFFAELAAAVRLSAAEILNGGPTAGLSPDELAQRLESAGVNATVAREAGALLRRSEAARFRPEPAEAAERRELVQEAERVLRKLERAVRRTPGARAAAGLVVALLAGSALAAAPIDDFAEGVAAYGAGDYATAGQSFAVYAAAAPADPSGWYNLGNAHFRAGRQGRAVWAWLQAVRRAPRHADARANLLAASVAPEAIDRVAPLLPLGPDEALLAASAAWLAGGLLLAWFVARRGTRAGITGAALAAAALLIFGAARAPELRGEMAVLVEPAALGSAPVREAAGSGSPLQPGLTLEIRETRGDWLRVRTLAGREGWVEASRAARL